MWFGVVAWLFVRERHHIVGGMSIGLRVLASIVQPAVGPGIDPMRLEYLVTVGTLVWFRRPGRDSGAVGVALRKAIRSLTRDGAAASEVLWMPGCRGSRGP